MQLHPIVMNGFFPNFMNLPSRIRGIAAECSEFSVMKVSSEGYGVT
jgi:hypothetical protein